jgi:hypothetical protein
VAEVVQHRLSQNETGLIMSLEDEDDAMHREITLETRRIHRLMRRFASWQAPTPRSRTRSTTARSTREPI